MIRVENCLICGKKIQDGYSTGYVFTETREERIGIMLFCSVECANKFVVDYANPIFQNKKALELFKEKHPRLWKRIKDKPKLFLEKEAEG